VSAAYDAAEWSDLFVASTGAAAALAGLLVVAVSINIERVLAIPGIPERALETLVILLGALVVSLLCLAPGVSRQTLGGLLLGESVVVAAAVAAFARHSARPSENRPRWSVVASLAFSAGATLPFLAGAISLIAGSGGGLYWTLGGVVLAFTTGVLQGWVLLVEILR
jgi:modulator of FtsH protease